MSKDIFENKRWFSMNGALRSLFDANILVSKIKETLEKNVNADEDPEAPMLEPLPVTDDPVAGHHFCRG